MSVTTTVVLKVPIVPSFIAVEEGRVPAIDIAKLTDDQLRSLGEAWTAKLLAHAARRREGK